MSKESRCLLRMISSLRHEEVKKTRLEPHSSWATCPQVSGLERALDPGWNPIPFKGDVATISPQNYSSSKMPAQRIVFLNNTNMEWRNVGSPAPSKRSPILPRIEHLTLSGDDSHKSLHTNTHSSYTFPATCCFSFHASNCLLLSSPTRSPQGRDCVCFAPLYLQCLAQSWCWQVLDVICYVNSRMTACQPEGSLSLCDLLSEQELSTPSG